MAIDTVIESVYMSSKVKFTFFKDNKNVFF